jgi:hypothetical protein
VNPQLRGHRPDEMKQGQGDGQNAMLQKGGHGRVGTFKG